MTGITLLRRVFMFLIRVTAVTADVVMFTLERELGLAVVKDDPSEGALLVTGGTRHRSTVGRAKPVPLAVLVAVADAAAPLGVRESGRL